MERLNDNLYGKFLPGQKYCLNCGAAFTARRNTRKYCSDNCKQLHFYKRNGTSLSGAVDNFHNLKNQAFSVKPEPEQLAFNVKDSVKNELHSGLKDFTVNDKDFTLNDKTIELLLDRLQGRIAVYMEQAINKALERIMADNVKQGFTVNDKKTFNVKEQDQSLAFNDKAIRNPEDLSKEENNDREEDQDISYQLKYIELSDDEPISNLMEREVDQNEEERMPEEREEQQKAKQAQNQNPAPEKPYESISSHFMDKVLSNDKYSQTLFMFHRPQNYWSLDAILHAKWVSQRFSTLIGTLLHLDAQSHVDKDAVYSVAEAFHQVYSSKHFSYLPANYPFIKLIKELNEKMIGIAREHQNSEAIRFRLSPDRKAQLIFMRWQMGDFVPRIKFSQTNFKEQINNNK